MDQKTYKKKLMSNIPTAKEFLDSYKKTIGVRLISDMSPEQISNYAIEFAKLHVQAALKAASKQAKTKEDVAIFAEGSYRTQVVDKESILNSYPLENIK